MARAWVLRPLVYVTAFCGISLAGCGLGLEYSYGFQMINGWAVSVPRCSRGYVHTEDQTDQSATSYCSLNAASCACTERLEAKGPGQGLYSVSQIQRYDEHPCIRTNHCRWAMQTDITYIQRTSFVNRRILAISYKSACPEVSLRPASADLLEKCLRCNSSGNRFIVTPN
jgi:hypothetical protein